MKISADGGRGRWRWFQQAGCKFGKFDRSLGGRGDGRRKMTTDSFVKVARNLSTPIFGPMRENELSIEILIGLGKLMRD